nr:unnamed protein product [Digitaria exilis]
MSIVSPPSWFEIKIITLLSPSHQMPSSSKKTEDVAYAVFRRCTTLGVFRRAENPTTIRCRPILQRCPAPHWRLPSNPGAVERCEQLNNSRVKTPGHQHEGRHPGVG